MIEDNNYNEKDIASICEGLFFGNLAGYAGNPGLKILADVLSNEKVDMLETAEESAEDMGLTQ